MFKPVLGIRIRTKMSRIPFFFVYFTAKNAWIYKTSGDRRSCRNHLPPLVGVSPAVVAAAVLSPAVPAANAAIHPPARISVSLMTLVSTILVAIAIEAASTLVVVATSSPVAPSTAAPRAATAASPLLPDLTPGGPVGDSLILTALIPSAF